MTLYDELRQAIEQIIEIPLESGLYAKLDEIAVLEDRCFELSQDLAAWLQLARRQYAEMPHNEPICPTSMGIKKTERILGVAPIEKT